MQCAHCPNHHVTHELFQFQSTVELLVVLLARQLRGGESACLAAKCSSVCCSACPPSVASALAIADALASHGTRLAPPASPRRARRAWGRVSTFRLHNPLVSSRSVRGGAPRARGTLNGQRLGDPSDEPGTVRKLSTEPSRNTLVLVWISKSP